MGACSSTNLEPEQLVVFKKLPNGTLLDNVNIPEREEFRYRTDTKYLIVFIVFIILLMPFLIYTLINSDMDRLLVGYDGCGNICGKKNPVYPQWECTGQDYTIYKHLQYDNTDQKTKNLPWWLKENRDCVEKCSPGYDLIGNKCIKQNSGRRIYRSIEDTSSSTPLGNYFASIAWRLVLCIAIGVGVTLLMIFLLRTATESVVWGILGGSLICGGLAVGALWYFYIKAEDKVKQQFLVFGIALTIIWLILLCVCIFMYRKIQLVIQILKEATKAALAMPLLIFTPILTFIAIAIIFIAVAITTTFMTSAGTLQDAGEFLIFEPNAIMIFTIIFNIIIFFWAVQFLIGIQYMVIAGAVSKWYFAKNKHHLDRPISTSARIVFKFHLGSIAFGSMIITLIMIIRTLITSLTKNKSVKACLDFFMAPIERFLKFLTKNAYILTAMHGKPFYKSGKRAAKIIFQNAVNITSINYIGDFVIFMAQLMIVLVTMLITYGIMQGTDPNNQVFAYLIVLIVTSIIAAMFFGTFETTIDTIFLCFCEDQLMNDGMARPYAMSRNLMEFVENSRKIYGDKR